MKQRALWMGAILFSFQIPAFSQTNNWTSIVTGNWHDLSWSLGVRPQSNHWVNVTNSGSKAVIVNSTTRDTYRTSMTVTNLVLSAPADATNTILLNFINTGVPFTIREKCHVGTNGVLLNLFSALAAGSLRAEGGIVRQEGGSNIVHGECVIGYDYSPGIYTLSNGVFRTDTLEVSSDASASFNQSGGQTSAREIWIGKPFRSGSFGVSNGLVQASHILIENGNFHQSNSDVVSSNGVSISSSDNSGQSRYSIAGSGSLKSPSIDVMGYDDGYFAFTTGQFEVHGAAITTDEFNIGDLGFATQTAGIISVRGDVKGGITLSGGLLMSSNTLIYNPHRFVLSSTYNQTGGTNITTNTFEIGYSAQYILKAGRLDVGNLVVGRGGQFVYEGGTFTNRGGVTLSDGSLVGGVAQAWFGPLKIENPDGWGSGLSFSAGNCVLHFANSAAIPWSSTAVLNIYSWNGLTNGGGNHRLFVGVNGLTPTQLEQVYFANPAGLPDGTYAGKLLPTGELVPDTTLRLAMRQSEIGLHLFWSGAAQLQSATNVTGPYEPILGASHPYWPPLNQAQRFYRLVEQSSP